MANTIAEANLKGLEGSLFYIFVNSQAAIQRLRGYSYHAKEANNLINLLYRKGQRVIIHWGPSYVGVVGNEIAESLAKKSFGKQAK